MFNVGVSRVDISPVAGVAHAGWGAQTHQVSLGNDMPSLVTALVVTNNDVELAIVDVDILLFHPEQDQQIRGLISEKSGILYENIRLAYTHTHYSLVTDRSCSLFKTGSAANEGPDDLEASPRGA